MITWLYTSLDPVLSAETTSVSSLGNRKAKATCTHSRSLRYVWIRVNWTLFQVMAQSAIDKIPSGPQLDALTAEKVFDWKNVHKHEGSLVGKKQDKAGHRRLAKVPDYLTNPDHAYEIEHR